MKKALWHTISQLLALVLLCLPACAQESMHFVLEPLPPFVIDDHGKAVGPYPDVVQAICTHLKMSCKFEILPWRRAFVLAEKGLVDGIFVLARTPEREKDFYFTDSVIQSNYSLFTRQSASLTYTQPSDLERWTVAAYGPSGTSQAVEDLAKQVALLRIEIEVDNQSVLRKLAGGRYGEHGAAVINRHVGQYLIARDNVQGLRIAGDIRRIDYCIALSRKRLTQAQADRFNGALHELQKLGKVKAIAEKYGMKASP